MNEPIVILLTTPKLATRNNPVAHLTTNAISVCYNVSMLWHYYYPVGYGPGNGSWVYVCRADSDNEVRSYNALNSASTGECWVNRGRDLCFART